MYSDRSKLRPPWKLYLSAPVLLRAIPCHSDSVLLLDSLGLSPPAVCFWPRLSSDAFASMIRDILCNISLVRSEHV